MKESREREAELGQSRYECGLDVALGERALRSVDMATATIVGRNEGGRRTRSKVLLRMLGIELMEENGWKPGQPIQFSYPIDTRDVSRSIITPGAKKYFEERRLAAPEVVATSGTGPF